MNSIGVAELALQAGSGEADTLPVLAVVAVSLLLGAVQLAGTWYVFSKAGRAGWAAIVPIYNLYVMLEIGDNGWWWLVLLFVPVVNIYAIYRIHAGVARAFSKGIGFGLGLAFVPVVFFPLLGFGDYKYTSPSRGALS
jgi:hypothetical protein